MNNRLRWLLILLTTTLPAGLLWAQGSATTRPAPSASRPSARETPLFIPPTATTTHPGGPSVPKAPRPTAAVAANTCANPGCHAEAAPDEVRPAGRAAEVDHRGEALP